MARLTQSAVTARAGDSYVGKHVQREPEPARSARPARPARPGHGPVRRLTVLYDPACRLCGFVRDWLVRQRQLVTLDLVPVGSPEAMRRFPDLDHAATSREITVVGDSGQLYRGDSAWVVCLWALADHRAFSHTLTTPAGRKLARAAVLAAAKYRESRQTPGWFPRSAAGVPMASAAQAASSAPTARAVPGWTYDKATGWTQGDPDVRPPAPGWSYDGNGGWTQGDTGGGDSGRDGGECADGCAADG